MDGGAQRADDAAGRRVLTVPNAISALRIALIPVFVWLILDPDTATAGLVLFAVVVATDWVDGTIARRTGQVTELGKMLDPVADRLAIAAGIIALAVAANIVWTGVKIVRRSALGLLDRAIDPGDLAPVRPGPRETAMVLYTSGSTGRPKGVPLSHDGQLWAVRSRVAAAKESILADFGPAGSGQRGGPLVKRAAAAPAAAARRARRRCSARRAPAHPPAGSSRRAPARVGPSASPACAAACTRPTTR